MALDPSIALGVKPIQFESPVNQMAKMYELQNAQQSNQLNQLNLGETQRKIEDRNRLRSTLGGFASDMSIDKQVNELARAGFLDEAKALAESAAKVSRDKRETDVATSNLRANSIKFHRDLLPGVKDQSSYEKWGLNAVKDIPELAQILPAQFTPELIPQLAMSADKFIESQKPIEMAPDSVLVQPSLTPGGKPTEIFKASPKAAATELKPLTAQQDTKLQHDIGKDRKTALDAIASFGDVRNATQKVREIPKSTLENVAGWTGYLPSVTSASQSADTDIANLKGKVTSLGKIAASAGGAIGTMAVQEWSIIRDMIAALDETKTTPAKFKEQMDLIDAQIAGAEERLRDSYATTHQEDFIRYPNRFELPAAGASAPPADKTTKAAPAVKRNAKDEADYQAWMKSQQKPKASAR
jgi:hypothetical protein